MLDDGSSLSASSAAAKNLRAVLSLLKSPIMASIRAKTSALR